MVRVPSDNVFSPGRREKAKLSAKQVGTSTRTTRSLRAWGMMMARNMAYSATLSALTSAAGSTLPASTPSAVPSAHMGMAMIIAP